MFHFYEPTVTIFILSVLLRCQMTGHIPAAGGRGGGNGDADADADAEVKTCTCNFLELWISAWQGNKAAPGARLSAAID